MKFQPILDDFEKDLKDSKAWAWVPRIQIMAGLFLFSLGMHWNFTADGWQRYLGGLMALGLVLLIVKEIQDHFFQLQEDIEQRCRAIERQFTAFICDATLGVIEEDDLSRLRTAAAKIHLTSQHENLSVDDFSLISRASFFWPGQNGFHWMDQTECRNCKKKRIEHAKDGSCPQ